MQEENDLVAQARAAIIEDFKKEQVLVIRRLLLEIERAEAGIKRFQASIEKVKTATNLTELNNC